MSTNQSLQTPDDFTAGDLWARRDALERDAASLLGQMLFEFSRVEVNLGLCLVWVDGGINLERLTKTTQNMNVKAKLDILSAHVSLKLPERSQRRVAYENWIRRFNLVRVQRNAFVHGRWGVEAHKNKVVNVVGLPTSDGQKATEYSIDELAAVNDELRSLGQELARLRANWPL
jgi:hypothetical protein